MGIDRSLSRKHPSVIINGSKYHYGRVAEFGTYLVEHEHIAKDYWHFKEKEDLEVFLINLPEAANHSQRIRTAYPDWHEVTPEQRDLYLLEDRLQQRTLAQQKVRDGVAHSFNTDYDGVHGPYTPQRFGGEPGRTENPLSRAEIELQELKNLYASRAPDSHGKLGALADLVRGLSDRSVVSGLNEAGKLRMIEGEVDWDGVSIADKQSILTREVDFSKMTAKQFAYVYEDIAWEKCDCPDPSAAQALFEKAHGEPAPSVTFHLDFDEPER